MPGPVGMHEGSFAKGVYNLAWRSSFVIFIEWLLYTTHCAQLGVEGGKRHQGERVMIPLRRLLKKEMALHSSILAWEIPWTEEPGRLESLESHRVGRVWATKRTKMYQSYRCPEYSSPSFSQGYLYNPITLSKTRNWCWLNTIPIDF